MMSEHHSTAPTTTTTTRMIGSISRVAFMTLPLVVFLLSPFLLGLANGFGGQPSPPFFARRASASTLIPSPSALFMSTFSTDGSDYSAKDSDFDTDDDNQASFAGGPKKRSQDAVETTELKPVPMSKNAGNRFVAIWFDRLLDTEDRDPFLLHTQRIEHTEDHVLFCRKANLYNETFNTDSMVDVMWSRQILSSDVRRVIGQAMCLESTDIKYVREFMSKEPLMQYISGGDASKISLYRWRHLRDYTLRRDDGRNGTPCMLINFDDDEDPEESAEIREETRLEHVEYLIKSERVIAAGALHVATDKKDDPASLPVGDLIMFNAQTREDAIEFAENEPRAESGLYSSMQAHFYNNLDVTGKFCAWDMIEDDNPCRDMKDAMEAWGYPVDDDQTPWLNW